MFGKALIVSLLAVLLWAVAVHPSSGAGREQAYIVKPSDTLWSIASAHYAGDPRAAVWKVERRNGLPDATIRVGEKLVLP